jgi:hypothetical protein
MVKEYSEPDGEFPYENFVSNEISYQTVLPQVKQAVQPGGAYLGVAPDQNFTYIAAIQPKIAFIIDIRRQNMIELLMYKALFEMAPDRATFLSRLFSRPRPLSSRKIRALRAYLILSISSSIGESETGDTHCDQDRLVKVHKFELSKNDLSKIDLIFNVFYSEDHEWITGSRVHSTQNVPSFEGLMLATDRQGTNWNFLQRRRF